MPAPLLIAVLTCCLLWGWVTEAGLFALSWGAILRTGEATSARRRDLILPADVLYMHDYVLLSIREPKTRLRVARHQAAKLEHEDLIQVVCLAFGDLQQDEVLWPRSHQTLRRRLDSLLDRLGVRPAGGQRAWGLSDRVVPPISCKSPRTVNSSAAAGAGRHIRLWRYTCKRLRRCNLSRDSLWRCVLGS